MIEGNFCCHKTTERSKRIQESDEQTQPHRGTDPWHQGNGGTERVLHGHTDPGGGSQCSTQFI